MWVAPIKESRNFSAAISPLMIALLRRRNWHLASICWLPLAYVRNVSVTPYLWATVRPRQGQFFVDGSIGVIHQEFEKRWIRQGISENSFSTSLHIANILTLDCYFSTGTLEQDAGRFCRTIADILDAMPQDETSLRIAFEANRMVDLPIDNFGGVYKAGKFVDFKKFVLTEMC